METTTEQLKRDTEKAKITLSRFLKEEIKKAQEFPLLHILLYKTNGNEELVTGLLEQALLSKRGNCRRFIEASLFISTMAVLIHCGEEELEKRNAESN